MNLEYFNNCPDYYPANFNKHDYLQNLNTLLNPQGTFGVYKHTFIRLGWIQRFFNAVSWFFGFEDITNTARINGEVLKFLHYGVVHDLIDENTSHQFKLLSCHAWIAPELNMAIGYCDPNSTNAEKLIDIRIQLANYYTKNKTELGPFFWKRKICPLPPVRLDSTSHFGETHLFKAALTDRTLPREALKHIKWAVDCDDDNLNYQKKCYGSFETLFRNSGLKFAEPLFPFVKKLAKNCIAKEQNYVAAENYLIGTIHRFQAYQLETTLKKIYFKQQKWDELTSCVHIFTRKYYTTPKIKSSKQITSLARGIVEIYRLVNNHVETIPFLKKIVELNPGDRIARRDIAWEYIKLASSIPNHENAIHYLSEAQKYYLEDTSIRFQIARHYVEIGNAILEENSSLTSKFGNLLKRSEPKSPLDSYLNAYETCPELKGPHIQWLITFYEDNKLFEEAVAIYNNTDHQYKLKKGNEYAVALKKDNNFLCAYEMFLLAHQFDSSNYTIKEEIIELGLHLAHEKLDKDPMLAVKYLQEIRPFVITIEDEADSSYHYPEPTIRLKKLDGRIRSISFDYAYDLAIKLVDECRNSQGDKEKMKEAVTWFEKALSVNPNAAEVHFELANFAKHFELEGVDIFEHSEKAQFLCPENYIYKLAHAEVKGLLTSDAGINATIDTLINPPADCLQVYMKWRENYYLKHEDRFYTVNPHKMTCVAK